MRNISFFLTTKQFKDYTKDVTRRDGWEFLKPGDILMAVEKCQGLKKGEKIKQLGKIMVKVRREPLDAITPHEVIREGFPDMTPEGFIVMFLKTHKKCYRKKIITRIEFKHVGFGFPEHKKASELNRI